MYLKLRYVIEPFVALVLLIILLPLFLVIGVWIKLDSKGPVLFKQQRIGQYLSRFDVYKFRSMRQDTPSNVPTHQMVQATSYITRSGRFLRKTSLDELPQLLNILKGDMSFIGPRPALFNQDDLVELRKTYNVESLKPGITGWAQIHGRDELELDVKAQLDGYYVGRASLWMDVTIIVKTLFAVIGKKGVVEGGTGTLNNKKKS
jgi:O-antigen biosynthesis protein WbqP